MIKTTMRAVSVLCIAATSLFAVGAQPALAETLSCGQTISTNTVLTADVTGCSGDGIVIGADEITLDLHGHTVSGTGGAGAGIRVFSHHNVVITHGTVSGFFYGVMADTSSFVTVSKVTAVDNIRGINLSNSSDSLIEKSVASGSGLDGIRLDGYGTVRNLVTQSLATDNVWGITVSNGASDNVVDRNTVTANEHGLPVFSSAASNTISRNSITANDTYGVFVGVASSGTAVQQNSILGNGTNGIEVDSTTSDTLLLKNDASYNGADGILVDSASTTITKNTATYNVDLGIEAVPGVTDGGGNVAYGNGNPAQCIGVLCAAQ